MYNIKINTKNYAYPINSGVVNFVTAYGADNTGLIDCSNLFRQAIEDTVERLWLYVPNGTYRIASPTPILVRGLRDGNLIWLHKCRIFGESEPGVVFKFDDNLFPDANNPVSWLVFGSINPTNSNNGQGNQSFYHRLERFTFDAGSSNSGLRIVDWDADNQGKIQDITFKCNNTCHTALAGTRGNNGPGYIGNIKVYGRPRFGITLTGFEYSQALEKIYIEDATEAAIRVFVNFTFAIRESHLRSSGQIVKMNEGFVTMENCTIESLNPTATSTLPAMEAELDDIFSGTRIWARNITCTGYRTLWRRRNANIETLAKTYYDEYTDLAIVKMFPEAKNISLRLPVEPFPECPEYPLSDWVYVGDPLGDPVANLAQVQAAFNGNPDKPVRYFRCNADYFFSDTLTIPDHVKVIDGVGGWARGLLPREIDKPVISISSDSTDLLYIKNLTILKDISPPIALQTTILNSSRRPLALESCSTEDDRITNISPPGGGESGKLYIVDFVGSVATPYPLTMFARHYNSEPHSPPDFGGANIFKNSNIWIFGAKTEDFSQYMECEGGQVEILSLFHVPYNNHNYASPPAVHVINNSNVFMLYQEGGDTVHPVTTVKHTKNGITTFIPYADAPNSGNMKNFILSTGESKKVPSSFFY